MRGLLGEAGIDVSVGSKKQVDRAIHDIVGIHYKDCPATWKSLKQMMAEGDGKQQLIEKLRQAIR